MKNPLNQKWSIWTLCLLLLSITASATSQYSGVVNYDFTDGTIITNGQSADGNLVLSGNYSHHSANYGLNMKVDGEIQITVSGSSTIRFLGSQYSGLNMEGTASSAGDLGTQNTQVTNDLSDTYDFVYSGQSATLTFKLLAGTGNDLYLPSIEVIPAQAGKDFTSADKNIAYFFDLRDQSIYVDGAGNHVEAGLIVIDAGCCNGISLNGDQHGITFKDQNTITLKVAGNTKIRVAGDQYSGAAIAASSTTGSFDVSQQDHGTSVTFPQGSDGGPWVDFTYVGDAGEVVLTAVGSTNYIPYIELSPIPYDISLSSYVQKTGTITLNGVDINLTTGATSSDPSTITVSEGVVLTSGVDEGWAAINLGGADLASLTPTTSGDIGSASIADGFLTATFSDQSTDPKTYKIQLFDNSYNHGIVTYDFRDGTIIANGKSDDESLKLAGNYSHHSADYGLNMKVDGTISIIVPGSSTIRFLGSQYSSLGMEGTALTAGDLGTLDTKVENDKSDTFDFTYSGPADTLVFKLVAGSGNDLYLPEINVIPAQMGAAYGSAATNIPYFFDFRDQSLVAQSDPGNTTIEKGLFKIESGPSNAYGYHGTQHGITYKDGNKITLQVAGNSKIRVAGDQYSGGTLAVSSATGTFDITSQSHATSITYPQGENGGPWVDFVYVGDAGTIEITGGGSTSYIPYIEVSPITYDISLTPWVQKSGTITINGVQIDFTSGSEAGANATVTVSEGTIVSATDTEASILIDLGGNSLDSFTPTLTGDITATQANENALSLTLGDGSSDPSSYIINISDNSQTVSAEAGVTYTYSFADGSELPQTSYQSLRYDTYVTKDGIVTINSNNTDEAGKFGYHDSAHGGVFFPGNSFDMAVAGNAIITYIVCTYGVAADAVFEFTDAQDNVLGSIRAENLGDEDGFPASFSYVGTAGVITATLKSTDFAGAEIYIHGLSIANEAQIVSNGKIDVWDFGGEQLDSETYNNWLDESTINGWYDESITAGSAGQVLPSSWSAGALSWVGGSNDRLRTSNTNLTRYDENLSGVSAYSGRIYVNSSAAFGRYMSLTLSEDDKVTLEMITQNGGGEIHFEYVPDPDLQNDIVEVKTNGTTTQDVNFTAKYAGTYHVYDGKDKPSYYRIYREDAQYATVTGNVDVTQATSIPGDYSINITNEAGKTWNVSPPSGSYSIQLPIGGTYELSLQDANAFIISSGMNIDNLSGDLTNDIAIEQVALYTLSGNITGLGDHISNLELSFTPTGSERIYIPEPIIDAGEATYSVELEPDVEYTISAEGVNDYEIPDNTISISSANESGDITFAAKPTYAITITADGLSTEQLGKLSLTFTNLNEEGYVYSFSDVTKIALRDGTYAMVHDGLDDYPLQLALTSNLLVDGAAVTKSLNFSPIHNWPFNDKVIDSSTPSYKGLLFTGGVKNEVAKGHLSCGSGQTIQVPVNAGEKVIITYYYAADFSIEGETAITTSSGSTSQLEMTEYAYTGSEAGYITITINASTYITNIQSAQLVAFTDTITVGADKDFQSINEALAAIRSMDRPNNERVTVMIDPGNYEEMLVIDIPNITFKNASDNPSIDLANKGVDIADDAVRITSYYGYGYSYYSQGDDNKWHADVLAANIANGYPSYENVSGSTNGSYWNATVVISSSGFNADHIIFENSFNQYISKKESEDVVVEWEVGGKGTRPTTYGSTEVQDRSFVERAAAIGVTSSGDKTILNNCRIVGRQDSFYGAHGARLAAYKGVMMGAVDYIFGGMTAVFYQSDLSMNVSDVDGDASYLTAAQQRGERGYLMYECNIVAPEPGVETASTYRAKPGYFGRPWEATTSEVVFYKTNIGTTDYPGSEGKSLISPEGWNNSLGGESSMMYEYGSIEQSGADNSSSRASWATLLTSPQLTDGTEITPLNFTKGSDGWDPFADLVGASQTITFNTIEDKTYGDIFNLEATASSSLDVSYEVVSGHAEIIGSEVTVTGVGEVTIRATQEGDDTYEPAPAVEQSFSAIKATVTATAANASITAGDDIPSFSISYSGFKFSDSEADLDELPTASTTATASSAAGSYDITLSGGSDANYDLELVNGTLTIAKKSQSITFDAIENKTYGDVFSVSASATSSLDVTFEIVNGPASIDANEVTITGAGDVTIKAVQSGNDNFEAAVDVEQTFSAVKAMLTATASDANINQGEEIPAFEITYSGFLFDDTEADLDTPPVASTTATTSSAAGTFDITVGNGDDDNYDFNYVNGTLTIVEILGLGNQALLIYPNPSSELINVNAKFHQLVISDLNGKVIMNRAESRQIDISQLGSGVFFVQLMDENGEVIHQQRLIKK